MEVTKPETMKVKPSTPTVSTVPPKPVAPAPLGPITVSPKTNVTPAATGVKPTLAVAVVKKQIVRVKAQLDELINTIILYGDSGLGKSSEAVRFAQWMYERYGKPLGLITSETSSQKIFESAIKVGIVKPFFLPSAEVPLAAMRKLNHGLWPKGSGAETTWSEPDFCGIIGEGLTSIAQTLLEECRDEGRLLREQKGDSWEFGDETFTTASQSAYGFVQDEMVKTIRAFSGLAGIRRILWTAHEGLAKTKQVAGPAMVGSARMADMPKYCGLLLHFENYPEAIDLIEGGEKFKSTRKKIRVWFDPHFDAKNAGLQFLAKTTIPAARVPELYAAYPNGYFDAKLNGTGLYEFLTLEEKLMAVATDALAKWKAEAEAKLKQEPAKVKP